MAIDIDSEELIGFVEARHEFPGREVSLPTMHRWRLQGCRGVVLETVVVGGQRFTSREAITRFIRAQNPGVKMSRHPRRGEAAGRKLEAMGVR